MSMVKWSLGDRLGILNLAIGVLGLLVIVVQVTPSLLPEVVVVFDTNLDSMEGFTTSTTVFENISYSEPVRDLSATWRVHGGDIRVAVDPQAPRYELIQVANERRLQLVDELPARYSFKTVFNSVEPFSLSGFHASANRQLVTPMGTLVEPIPVIKRELYDTLVVRRLTTTALIILGWLVAYWFLVVLTRKSLANWDKKRNRGDTDASDPQLADG